MENNSTIFNKSYDDLSKLYEASYTKYVFVFDFDLTLTFKSSDGIKINSNYMDLFESNTKLSKLKEYLKKLNDLGNTNYINTRGMVNDINHILKNVGIEIGPNKMIKEIKGSKNIENINTPFTKLELKNHNLIDIKDTNVLWAIKKVTYLNNIKEIEHVDNNRILFFDDSAININTARLNGYNNCFLIGSNDSGLYGLDYLLIKLEQIIDLLF